MEQKMYKIGKLVNTHGVLGEVRVIKVTDFEERFEPGETVYWVSPDHSEVIALKVDGYRKHKQFELLHFEGYDNINDVEKFKGGLLKITEEQLTPLDDDEFYYHEIIGCDVFTVQGSKVGKIKEILSPGANDVWVVSRPKQKDVLIPFIDDVVTDINIHEKKVIIEPMEGLLD